MMPGVERRVLAVLVSLSGLLLVASATARYLDYRAEVARPGHVQLAVVQVVDINGEANVASWWGSALLLCASLLALALAVLSRQRGLSVLALLLAAMSMDEVAALHERLDAVGKAIAGNAMNFAWVIPGSVIAVVLLVILARALRSTPASLRRGLAFGGAVYLFGAIVLEAAGGPILSREGDGTEYLLITSAEEGCEMVGAALLIHVLLVALDVPGIVRAVDRGKAAGAARPLPGR